MEAGRAGPHAALIARDVPRAFGAVAPHKRRDRGDGSSRPRSAAVEAAVAAAATADTTNTLGGEINLAWFGSGIMDGIRGGGGIGIGVGRWGGEDGYNGHEGADGEGAINVPGLGLLTNLLGLGPEHDDRRQQQQQNHHHFQGQTLTPGRTGNPNRKSFRRASSSNAGLRPEFGGGDEDDRRWGWLPHDATPQMSTSEWGSGTVSPPSRGRSPRPFSLSPPRSCRSAIPPPPAGLPPFAGAPQSATGFRRTTIGIPSSAAQVNDGAGEGRVAERLANGGGGRMVDYARQDAIWLAEAEALWEGVPVEAKRQCLGNVLFAVAAQFPDVGYCQVKHYHIIV